MSRSSVLVQAGDLAADVSTHLAVDASARLLPIAAALLVLAALQLVAASCTPEPAPYAARASVER